MFDEIERPTERLSALETTPPSAATLAELMALVAPGDDLSDADRVTALQVLTRHLNWLEAEQTALVGRISGPATGRHPDYAAEEVAAALALTVREAERQVHTARMVTTTLVPTGEAWRAGRLSRRHVEALLDGTTHLDDATTRAVEARVLPGAGERTVATFRSAVARAVLAVDAASAEVRHERRARQRRLEVWPQVDGIARLSIEGPADDVLRVYGAADAQARLAKRRAKAEGADFPGLDAARFDALVALVLGNGPAPGGGRPSPGGRALLRVTVPLASVQGHSDTPGEVDGYGPVPASVVRRMAATARWQRVTLDDEGGPVEVSTPTQPPADPAEVRRWVRRPLRSLPHRPDVHDPGAHLSELVAARFRVCTFPGCNSPAHRNDDDHIVEFPAGPTTLGSLHPPCERHHRARHEGGWRVRREGDAVVWTSPTGHDYAAPPEPYPLE